MPAMWHVLVLILVGLTGAVGGAPSGPPSLDELVQRIQNHLDRVNDFEARFRQRYHRQVLGRTIEETGRVAVKKPGRMRWDYLSPEEKLFLADGTRTYFYLPEEKQVFVNHSQEGALGISPQSPLSLLAGRSRVRDAFEVKATDSRPQSGGVVVQLIPRHRYEDIEKIELEVDSASGRVLRVLLVDSLQNRTEFIFDHIKENQDLPDSLFLFTIPSGVDIVVAPDRPSQRHD